MKLLKSFFSYVPADPLPEMPREESPDPNANRQLSDAYRTSRRNLVVICGLCLAWSSAQFSILDPRVEIAGLSFHINNISIPLVFFVSLLYLTMRWGIEYAMMERHIRRWTLAQLDFKTVSVLVRLSVIAVTAGAINQSLKTIAIVILILLILAISSVLLSGILMMVTMPIRMRARAKVNRVSAANAAGEALYWATILAVLLCVIATISLGVASYHYEPLKSVIWPTLPNPVSLVIFVITLIVVFLSIWFLQPVYDYLFAKRPSYFTERGEDGKLIYTIF